MARWNKTGRRIRQLIDFLGVDEVLEANLNRGSLTSAGTDLPAASGTSRPSPARPRAAQAEDLQSQSLLADGPPRPVEARSQRPQHSERQLRPLVGLPKDEQVASYKLAEEMAGPGKQPTGKQVATAVERWKAAGPKPNEHGVTEASGEWVICRPPMKGATSPTVMVPRYSGPGWGWSPNPEKGKPFTNKQTALTEAARHGDDVVSLEEARRPAPATIQVKAHERTVGDSPKAQDLVDARFRVVDARVELQAALVLINKAGLNDSQEHYHAERAADHLGCLEKLLANGGGRKAKG